MIFNIAFTQPSVRSNAPAFIQDKWQKERAFYDWSAAYNYVSYTTSNVKTEKHKDSLDYYQKSMGAFGLDHSYTKEELDEFRTDLKKSKSIIWHGFISFNTELSKRMNTEDDCIKYLKQNMGVLIDNSTLRKENLNFVFSLHKDTNNRHIHFQFWEKEATKENKKGELSFTKKGMFSQMAIDNFMVQSGIYFDEKKYEVSTARDEAMQKLKDVCPSVKTIAKNYGDTVIEKLAILKEKLPKTGRIAYNSYNMKNLQKEVDLVVNYLVNHNPDLHKKVKSYYKAVDERIDMVKSIMEEQNFAYISKTRLSKEDIEKLTRNNGEEYKKELFEKKGDISSITSIQKLSKDLQSRMGNYIVTLTKNTSKEELKARMGNMVINLAKGTNEEPKEQRKISVNDKSAKIAAKQRRFEREKALKKFMHQIKKDNFMARAKFTYELHKAEYEINVEQREVEYAR